MSTLSYKISTKRKAGMILSAQEVTVIGSMDESTAKPSVHPLASSSQSHLVSYISSQEFMAMNDKWTEQFARFEALVIGGSICSTP